MPLTLKLCCPLFFFLLTPLAPQDEVDMQRRRFKQAINAYLSRSRARDQLAEVLTERAETMKLSDEKLKSLRARYNDAISKFVDEQAIEWANNKKAPTLFRAHSKSLTRSTYFIEISTPWRAMVEQVLDEDEVKTWNEWRDEQLAAEALRMKELAETAAKQQEQLRQQREAQAVTFAQQVVGRGLPIERLRSMRSQMLEYCRSLLTVSERNARKRLARDVDWMDELFQLTKKQRRKLELAMSGVTKRALRDTIAEVTTMEAENPDSDEAADAQVEKMMKIFKRFAPPLVLMRNSMMGPREPDSQFDFLTEDPLWLKAIGSTLSDEQVATFEAERKARRAFLRDVQVREIVLSFDQVLRLRIEQREALIKLFRDSSMSLAPFRSNVASQTYSQLSDETTRQIDQVLTDSQRTKLSP